ncbi:hypothetical protein OG539_11530 [Actinacidiphila glaucinigra]|uniref:hypothetical protein n=1 Tax=Actinacidiphila glaucinigra TaxID=235986 RepID=UPI002DDB2554|nr:hypothetical protein [Actinacidiphila glaucinigra]WSD63034.1 hypothetical protein OIE69_31155 [Actinacidiphila glaucinigra]
MRTRRHPRRPASGRRRHHAYGWQNGFDGGSLDAADRGIGNGSHTHVWHRNGTTNQLR